MQSVEKEQLSFKSIIQEAYIIPVTQELYEVYSG